MKTSLHHIEEIAKRLEETFPGCRIEVDSPGKPGGSWFLDVEFDDHFVVVEWREREGFGITCQEEIGFGVGADEIYHDSEAVYARVVSLLIEKAYTRPPALNLLQELRKERGITQESLADLLKVRQAALSKLERRHDVLVSTVRDVVRSMGGDLTITARFPDGMQRTIVFEEPEAAPESGKPRAAKPRAAKPRAAKPRAAGRPRKKRPS